MNYEDLIEKLNAISIKLKSYSKYKVIVSMKLQ